MLLPNIKCTLLFQSFNISLKFHKIISILFSSNNKWIIIPLIQQISQLKSNVCKKNKLHLYQTEPHTLSIQYLNTHKPIHKQII